MVTVTRIANNNELESLATDWDHLAVGHVFQHRDWLWNWWYAYGQHKDLYVLRIHDEQLHTIGILPCYRERSVTGGRQLRLMGSGKACTDYQSAIVASEHREAVADATAEWLLAACDSVQDGWDLLEFESVPNDDTVIPRMIENLASHGGKMCQRDASCTWRNDLVDDWDAYLIGLRKKVRQRVRRLFRKYVETGRAQLVVPVQDSDFESQYDAFVQLHQRRWDAVGIEGCFSTPEFTDFLRRATFGLRERGRVWLTALRLDGKIAAVALFFRHNQTVAMYQCGVDPEAREHQPGWLINAMSIREMIANGTRVCDYLRGDERYKSYLGAVPVPQVTWRCAAPRSVARMRHELWLTQDRLRDWGQP